MRPRISGLFSAIATSRPSANVIATVPIAKAKFQTTMRRNEPRIVSLVKTRAKLSRPTLTFQPWARLRCAPSSLTKEPFSASATQTLPVVASVMQSHPSSYDCCGAPSNAVDRPWLLIAPSSVGTLKAVMSSWRALTCGTVRIV